MKTFEARELLDFIAAVDRNLAVPCEVVLIGGCAAALAYGFSRATREIDTWTPITPDLETALARARLQTGLDIPVEHAGVADAPHGFEDRLQPLRLDLERLQIEVPEKHDLVLMRIMRGYEHDVEAIEGIHKTQDLDFETLISRYTSEMGHVVRTPQLLDLSFLNVVERVFGGSRADQAERRIKAWRASGG